jgi:hypothetical protein
MVSLAKHTTHHRVIERRQKAREVYTKAREVYTDHPDALETLVQPVPDGQFGHLQPTTPFPPDHTYNTPHSEGKKLGMEVLETLVRSVPDGEFSHLQPMNPFLPNTPTCYTTESRHYTPHHREGKKLGRCVLTALMCLTHNPLPPKHTYDTPQREGKKLARYIKKLVRCVLTALMCLRHLSSQFLMVSLATFNPQSPSSPTHYTPHSEGKS